jgi:glycosyltransferase involved in cell wall biosynthesis
LKIAIIGPAHPLRGGIADFNEALCKGFMEAGLETCIFSFSYQYPGFLFPGKSQFTSDPPDNKINIYTTIHSLNPLSWLGTARRIIRMKPDLVIVRFWLPFMAPALGSICRLIRRKGIQVIAITDNVIPHEKRPGDKILTSWFLHSCDAFIAMSGSVLQDVRKFIPGAKLSFLPHPVYDIFGPVVSKEYARNHLNIPHDRKVILFFGFIRAYKGLDLLLEAMADERLREQNVHLIVAGEFYEDSKPYLKIVENNGMSGRVSFFSNYIPKEEVRYFFCAADMVVQPYRSATQSGITQIAYHFERPMLVTHVGGLSEIVIHNKTGYVTEPEPRSIADAVFNFYSQSREREIADHVRLEKVRFSWKSFVEGVLQLYNSMR